MVLRVITLVFAGVRRWQLFILVGRFLCCWRASLCSSGAASYW